MSRLFYKDKQPIGLDISETSVKVMAVDPQHWMVQGYGSIDLDPAKMQLSLNDKTGKNTYLAESVAELFHDNTVGDLPSNHVIIGVPTNRTYSRTFTLPLDQEKNLREAIEIEVSQYIPIPLASLYIDYEVINRTESSLHIIMAAIPKTVVDSAISAAKQAGLRPVAVEPSINAVARLLETTEEGHLTTLIIDIGQANTDIAVLSGGAIRITGGAPVGGNTFTIDIAKKLKVPLNNAHQLKVLNGLAPSPRQSKITKALTPSLEHIENEVRKVMRYYTDRVEDASKIEQVLIVGAGSNMPGIGDYYTNALIMPVRVASPWQQLDFGKLAQPGKQFRPRYITVAGLASIAYEEILR